MVEGVQQGPVLVGTFFFLANSVYILAIWSTCCWFDKRKAGKTPCRVCG